MAEAPGGSRPAPAGASPTRTPPAPTRADLRSALAYGLLSIRLLATVTGASTAILIGLLAAVLTAPRLVAGPAYRDIPAAVIATGCATALACLASAAAYLSQYAYNARSAGVAGARTAPSAGLILHLATVACMAAAYVAFAVGGMVFIHFCLTCAPALGHPRPS